MISPFFLLVFVLLQINLFITTIVEKITSVQIDCTIKCLFCSDIRYV